MNDGGLNVESVDVCSKALARLDGVWEASDSIVHEVIQRAIDLGCSDADFVYVDDLMVGRINRSHIQSMKTEVGNAYGRYFDGVGRGSESQVCFVAAVWKKLRDLNWAKYSG